jgi:hypothetical protein
MIFYIITFLILFYKQITDLRNYDFLFLLLSEHSPISVDSDFLWLKQLNCYKKYCKASYSNHRVQQLFMFILHAAIIRSWNSLPRFFY